VPGASRAPAILRGSVKSREIATVEETIPRWNKRASCCRTHQRPCGELQQLECVSRMLTVMGASRSNTSTESRRTCLPNLLHTTCRLGLAGKGRPSARATAALLRRRGDRRGDFAAPRRLRPDQGRHAPVGCLPGAGDGPGEARESSLRRRKGLSPAMPARREPPRNQYVTSLKPPGSSSACASAAKSP
jgi:hypothetical protein